MEWWKKATLDEKEGVHVELRGTVYHKAKDPVGAGSFGTEPTWVNIGKHSITQWPPLP